MADFPTTTPPVIQEHIDYIRWWLGNITDSIITDLDLTTIIAMNIGKYEEDNCKIVYNSTLDTVRWLIREQAKDQGGSSGSGVVSKIKEKIKNREKEITYDTSSANGTDSGWGKVLQDLLDNPSTIGCNPIDNNSVSGVIIGVNTEKYTFSSPWRKNLNPLSKKIKPLELEK
jgi:hypothetical protein